MLQPDQKKKLDTNIRVMLEGGASPEDVNQYAKDFTSKFGDTTPVKKKENSISESTKTKSPSTPQSGPSAGSVLTPSNPLEYKSPFTTASKTPEVKSKKKDTSSNYEEGTMAWNLAKLSQTKDYVDLDNKLKQNTQVSDQRKVEIQKEVSDEVNGIGVWNTINKKGKEIYNSLSDNLGPLGKFVGIGDKQETDVLAKEKKEARDILIQKGIKNKDITNDLIKKTAFDLKVEKRIKSEEKSKLDDYLAEAEDEYDLQGKSTKDKLEFQGQIKVAGTQQQKTAAEKRIGIKDGVLYTQKNNLEKVNSEIVKLQKQGVEIPSDLLEAQKQTIVNYQKAIDESISSRKEYVEKDTDLKDAKSNLDYFKRDYSKMNNILGNVVMSLEKIAVGTVGALDYGLEVKQSIFGRDANTASKQEGLRDLVKSTEEFYKENVSDKIMKPIQVEDIHSVEEFGRWFGYTALSSQVPTFAAAYTGVGGIGLLGASSTGQKFTTMQNEMNPENPEPGQIIPQYSESEMLWKPFAYGVTETASAVIDKIVMGNAGKILKTATEPERQMMAKGMASYFIEATKDVSKNAVLEGFDEGMTQGAQNLIDGKPFMDGMKDPTIAGAVIGGLLPLGSHSFNMIYEATKPFSTDGKIQSISKEILSLQSQLDKASTPETKKIISEQIKSKEEAVKGLLSKRISNIESLSKEQFQEVLSLEKAQQNIKNKVKSIQADTSIDDDMTKQIMSNLKTEFDANESRRKELISGGASTTLEKMVDGDQKEIIRLKDQAQRELMTELNPDGTKDVKIEDNAISKKAIQILNKEQASKGVREESPSEVVINEQSGESGTAPVTTEPQSNNNQINKVNDSKVSQEINQEIPNDSQIKNKDIQPSADVGASEIEIKVAEKAKIQPKNFRDLYKVNREVFGQNKVKALASAVVMDRMIGTMAKKSNVNKEEIYKSLEFQKADEQTVKNLSEKGKVLYQVVGKNARLSKGIKDNLSVARNMEKSGSDAKAIRLTTGWEKGADGKWGYEIDDSKTSLKQDIYDLERGNLKDLLNHNELFELYPDLANIEIVPNFNMDSSASANPDKNRITINPDNIKDNQDLLTTVLHEVQHFIQEKEGFSKGGSEENIRQVLEDKISNKSTLKRITDKLFSKNKSENIASSKHQNPQELLSQDDYKLYESLVGEVQARNVETRQSMSPEERQNTLLSETEDISRESQIILFQESKGAVQLGEDGKAVIFALTDPDVSTPLHELAHVYEKYLSDTERDHVLEAAGTKEWTTETSEFFARGFEKYLAEGIAPDPTLQKIFDKFKEWLTDIYNGIKDSEIDLELNPKMTEIYSQMLGVEAKSKNIKQLKISDSGSEYTATFENGRLEFTDKNGKEPSAPTKRKLQEKWANDFDFTKGRETIEIEAGAINIESYEAHVAEYSENPAEVAEALLLAQSMDAMEGIDYKTSIIAEAIGSKSIERQSFIDNSDVNNITQGIAMQYFAKKGEGRSLDTLAQEMSETAGIEVTEQDIVDFILDNPSGTESFINSVKKDKLRPLQERFEELTGLPANQKFLDKAIQQSIEKTEWINNYATSLSFISNEKALLLLNELEQSDTEQYGKTEKRSTTNASAKNSVESKDSERSTKESGVQSESGPSNIGSTKESTEVENKKSTFEKITNQDNIKDNLDWLDSLKLDPNNLSVTLPFLPQTWNAFIEAVKLAVKAGNTIENAIDIAAEELQKKGFSFKEIKAVVENFTQKAEGKIKEQKGDFTRKEGKSSVLSRLNNSANSEKTLKLIDKIGLNYAIRRQETVYADATNFVNEVGVFEAYNAIQSGKVTHGDSVMVMYSQILNNLPKEIDNIMDNLKENDDTDAIIESLNKFQEAVLSEYGARATMAGQTAAIMNYIYNQNQEVQYSLSNQIESHKKINNGEISPETMAKFKEIDAKYKEALAKIKELEAERDAQIAQQNFNNIVEQIKRTAPKNVAPNSQKAKELADKVRKIKIPLPQGLRSSAGAEIVYNSAVEVIAKSIETTGHIADSIQKGVKLLQESDWYKSLTKPQQNESINNLINAFGDIGSDITISQDGEVKVPISMVRNFISGGGTDINELAKQVKSEIQDEHPDITERQIRDAISGYGKTVNKTRSQLKQDINKLKRLGKLESILEDLQKGINKAKTQVEKSSLSEKEKSLLAQIKSLKNDLGITESERTSRAEGYVKKRIAELKEKIKNEDFSKKEVKPIEESEELKKLRVEKNRLQEEYDYLNYSQEMANRTLGEKIKDAASDLWDAQRTTLATGELSFVGLQGSFYMVDSTFSRKTLKNLANNFKGTTTEDWAKRPLKTISKLIKSAGSANTLIEMFNKMGTKNNYDDFQAMIKEHPMYDVFLKSGLRILGEDVKTQVRDDNFLGNNVLNIIKIPFRLIAKADKNTKRTTVQGYYEKLKTGNVSEKNKRDIGEMFDAANPLSVFERGNNTFMNVARIDLFMRGAEALQLQGKNPIDHIAEYKKLAGAINTVTGSANLSKSLTMAIPVLNKTFFSARLWASSLNLTPPISFYYFFKLGNYDTVTLSNPSTWKNVGVSVAQKTFLRTSVKGLLAAHGAAALTVMAINSGLSDEDDEEKEAKRAYIEYDPRSSNFLQVVSGDTRMDYFGPVRGNVVLFSKLASKQTKNKAGDIVQNGEGFFNRTNFEIASSFIANKANPFPGMFAKNWQGKEVDVEDTENETTEKRTVLDFGGDYVEDVTIKSQLQNNMIPIYYKGINDIFDEDPVLGSEFHLFMSFIGKQTNVYGGKTSIKKEGNSYRFPTKEDE